MPHNATRHSMKCDVINDVKLFPTVYPAYSISQDIPSQIFYVIQSEASLQNQMHKNVLMPAWKNLPLVQKIELRSGHRQDPH